MIEGIVQRREAQIRLTVRGFRGLRQEIKAVVDTGYTGWLALTPRVISALSLLWRTFGRGILADGSVSLFDVYQAKVLWDGRARPVLVRARGKVAIKRLPRK
jgi:predicted aspartyl protease